MEQGVKIKDNKKSNKNLPENKKKQWNMNVKVIQIVIGALETVQGLVKVLEQLAIGARAETMKIALLR